MRRYRGLQLGLSLSLALYFVAGMGMKYVVGRSEVYPVFSWALFGKVPNEQTQFALRILAYDGSPLDDGLLFEQAEGIVAEPHSIAAQHAIRRLGTAATRGTKEEEAEARHLLEQIYLKPGLRYEIVRVRYEPLSRWRTGEREIEPIRSYSTADEDQ
ncbi:MAG: hypothetical protein KAJ43_12450 [Gemmatimonadetes bacterium]|nr:hypothetical protein [Gemmatimonadota bacterium]